MTDSKEIVTFLDANGNEISNDPRWHAKRILAESGVDAGGSSADVQTQIAEKDKEIEALRAALAAKETEEALEDDEEPTGDYSDIKGADLAKLAKERGIDVKGKKAGQVRAELIAQDQAK